MKLKSLNKLAGFLILIFLFQPLTAEEEIDIWNKEAKEKSEIKKIDNSNNKIISNSINTSKINNNIKIEKEILSSSEDAKIFGIYDPAENNFDLNMWAQTDAEKIRSSFNRINKISLSNIGTKIFEYTILSLAYPPKGMVEQ